MAIALAGAVFLFMVGSVLLNIYATKRTSRGEWRYAPLLIAPRVALYAVMAGAGVLVALHQPLVGVPASIFALIMLAFYLRLAAAVSRAARSGKTHEQLAAEIGDIMVEPLVLSVALVLLGGFLGLIALIVFGVAERLG